jgi:hypothetical protein
MSTAHGAADGRGVVSVVGVAGPNHRPTCATITTKPDSRSVAAIATRATLSAFTTKAHANTNADASSSSITASATKTGPTISVSSLVVRGAGAGAVALAASIAVVVPCKRSARKRE